MLDMDQSPYHVLVASSDADFVQQTLEHFRHGHFHTDVECDGAQVAARVCHDAPAVVVADVQLAHKDGFEVCRELRPWYGGVVVIASCRQADRAVALAAPLLADVHARKPLDPVVLERQIQSCLDRRATSVPAAAPAQAALRYGSFQIHAASRSVQIDGHAVDCGDSDFDLLLLLARHAGQLLSRDQIMQALRGFEYDGADRSIDMRISRLRRSLGEHPAPPEQIRTVRNKGYLLAPLEN